MKLVNSHHPENQHLSFQKKKKEQATTADLFLNLIGYLHDS